MFEQAIRTKLRFTSIMGLLTVEDLWDLPLSSTRGASLNSLAKSVSRSIRASEEEDFVGEKTKSESELEYKLDILKHVIKVRLEENAAKVSARARKEKKEKILGIIEQKQDSALQDMSEEDLKKLLTDL